MKRPNSEAIETQRERGSTFYSLYFIVLKVFVSTSHFFLILMGGRLFLRSIAQVFVKNFRSLEENLDVFSCAKNTSRKKGLFFWFCLLPDKQRK